MTNPRSKGKRGEYKVRDALSEWYGKPFKRTPGSGAWGSSTKSHALVGDVVCDDPNFPFSIEVKNTEKWELSQLLTSSKSPIYKYWEQTVLQANKADLYPMLVFMRARHTPLIMLDVRHHFVVQPKTPVESMTLHSVKYGPLTIMTLEEFTSKMKVRVNV